jgi:hypothetical protein
MLKVFPEQSRSQSDPSFRPLETPLPALRVELRRLLFSHLGNNTPSTTCQYLFPPAHAALPRKSGPHPPTGRASTSLIASYKISMLSMFFATEVTANFTWSKEIPKIHLVFAYVGLVLPVELFTLVSKDIKISIKNCADSTTCAECDESSRHSNRIKI